MKNCYLLAATLLTSLVSFAQSRVIDDLLHLYTFGEGSGQYIHDLATDNIPLILEIQDPSHVSWGDPGLTINEPTLIRSISSADELNTNVSTSGEISLEAWITPGNLTQDGPARIITVSNGSSDRNVMIGQDDDTYVCRMRTTDTDNNGIPNSNSPGGSVELNLQHIIYTRNASGEEHIFLNGESVHQGQRDGDLSNWSSAFHLALGNEIGVDRAFVGTYHLVAAYDRALSAEEVTQNFNAGAVQPGATPSESTCETEFCWIDGFGASRRSLWLPNLPDDVDRRFEFDENGGHFDVFEDGTAHIYGHCINQYDEDYGFYVDFWFTERKNWEEWSDLGRGWKGDPNIVGNLYETWDYYIMDEDQDNVLIGTGLFEGSLLNVTHKPSDYYYGLQVGEAANDQNAEPGMSCWFDYTGQINGEDVSGNGDINLEGECNDIQVMNCAVDVTVDCVDGGFTPDITGEPTIYCDEEYTLTHADEVISEDCPLIIERTWTATSTNGNVAVCTQTITLIDESAPVFIQAPEDMTVECGQIPDPVFEFEDDCYAAAVVTEVSDVEFSGTCAPTIERTITLTDLCGNTATHSYFITVVDTTEPMFTATPNDLVLSCGDDIPEFTPSVEDNCGTPEVIMDESTSSIDCGTLIIRTWTASDACGNTTSINQQIFIEDNEGPSPVNALSDATVSCDNIPPYSEVVFEDDCSEILEVNISEEQVGEGCEYLLVRTYTASDVCGNTTVLMQTLTVVDETAPEFVSVPENEILNCGTEIPDLSPVAIDQCNEVVLAYSDEWLDGEGCAQLLRTWSATDDCGNIATAETVYTFVDEEAPLLSGVPQGGSVGCEDLTDNAIVTAMDACDGQIPVFMDETVSTENCVVTITRVWSATDYCGNVASAEVVFTYEDNAAPSITAEPEVTIECAELQASNLIEVIDDCDFALEIGFEEILLEGDAQGCNRTLERTWFASDACGNEASFTQIINVVDESAPVFEFVPADIEVACGETPPYEEPIATDNCTEVTVALAFELVSNGCYDQLVRTWTATDNCGNSSSAQQVVTFVDSEAPELSEAPANLVLDCEASIPNAAVLTGSDNCGEVTIEFEESIIDGDCSSEYTIERTWTAVDNCGNTATRVQMISITDTTAPIFDFTPEDITAECGDIPAPPVLTASDNCGEVTIDYSEDVDAGGCPNIYRTWIASDGCGNETMFVQTVFVQDTEPPVLTGIPGDMEVSCSTIPVMPEPEVSDNCDQDVAVTANESIVGSGCEFTIIRTWIASDDCGNTTIVSQSLNVTDTEAPVFVEAPQDITIECTEIDLIPLPEVFDDCAATVNISYEDSVLGSGCNYDIERTYTATDNCGQSATATQLIHVVDTTAPVISGVGANTFVDCSMVPEPDAAVAVDGCGGAVELEVVDTIIDQDACNYIISRTYIAADQCGNGTALTQLIYVTDVQEPVFIGLPDDITVDCTENAPAAPNVGATDNCSANVTVSMAEISEENGCSTIITRIWSATDDCGNTAMATRTVTVTDLTAPIFDEVPASETVSCDAIPEVITPTATDNCDNSVEVNYNEEIISGGCPYEIRRTFIAVDDCGNETIAVQQIFVIDNEAPVLIDLPQDLVVTCAELPAPANVTATDNCSGATVLFEEQIGGDGCTQILNRTWTAIDLCGNTTSYTQSITVIDESAPVFLETPEDLTVSCLMVPEFVMLEAYDDCGIADVQMEEIITETDCITEYSILRIWTITDACGLSSSYSQEIEVVDDIAPILVNVPENVTVDCDNIPEIPEVSAIESCGELVDVTFTEEIIVSDNDNDDCEVGNASGLAGDIALWLPGVDGVAEVYVYGPNGGTLTLNEANGTAHLTGEVFSVDNANHSFMLDVHLHEQRTWDEWSALGRDYKDDLGIAVYDFMDWSYFILNGETSRLIGTGSFEGSELSMSHAPADSTFGFQLGMNANNFSEGYGLGGWFFYEGELNGQAVNGVGDMFTENYCCQDQEIIRTWTAIDCAGNVATYTQTITVTNLIPEGGPQLIFVDDYDTGFDVRGSAGDDFIITYEPTFSGAASIALFDLQGHQLDVIYDAQVIEGAVYTLRVPKAGLTPGVYVFTAAGDNRILTDTEMVLR